MSSIGRLQARRFKPWRDGERLVRLPCELPDFDHYDLPPNGAELLAAALGSLVELNGMFASLVSLPPQH